MSLPSRQFPRWTLLAAALALPLAACSDVMDAPTAVGPRGPARSTASVPGNPRLISNTTKYSDRGLKPATGRSGSASLTAFALRGRDGRTVLEVGTGEPGSPAPGSIEKLQVKMMDPEGDTMRVLNRNGLDGGGAVSLELGGLPRGAGLQVQANVRAAGAGRTGVVTVTETVKLRPDLAAQIYVPTRTEVGGAIGVGAVVTERNGDVGARADCVLYVDGVATDRANGIWVDAGDVVSCYFFSALVWNEPGTHLVEVRVEGVSPGDYDESNNVSGVNVEVSGGSDFSYMAGADESDSHVRYASWGGWSSPWGSNEWRSESRESSFYQQSWLSAWIPKPVRLAEARIEVSQSSGGVTLHSQVIENPPLVDAGYGVLCADLGGGAPGVAGFVCSSPIYGSTSASYGRSAGRVTYYSGFYTRTWYSYDGTEYFYSDNHLSESQWMAAPVPFGDDYTFHVRVTDPEVSYAASPVIRLELTPPGPGTPAGEVCDTYEIPDQYSSYSCQSTEYTSRFRTGTATFLAP